MARPPRSLTVVPNHAVHKVWRGHNREWNLETPEQKAAYLEYYNLDVESEKYQQGAVLNAATLMSNHTHEVSNVQDQGLYSNQMRRHHARYGAYFNRLKGRCGKVAQDRPHTTLLENRHNEMEAIFYIHANPIRANIVKDAKDYFWSTQRLYAFGKRENWMRNIALPAWYQALGRNPQERQRAYRRLFARYLKRSGLVKQFFLKGRFFGTPLWCLEREKKVTEWRRLRSPPPS